MSNRTKPPRSFNTVKNSNHDKRVQRRQQQKILILVMFAVIILLAVALLALAGCSIVQAIRESPASTPKDPPSNQSTAVEYDEITLSSSDFAKGELAIVNKSNRCNTALFERDLIAVNDQNRLKVNGANVYQYKELRNVLINKTAFEAFEAMMKKHYEVTEDGSVALKEAFRSEKSQESIGTSTPAGFSDHHTGYLLTLTDADLTSALPSNHWIYQNGYKYGFISRYPSDKKDVTGVSNYPEALRYVGVAHATYMFKSGLCLEEYVEFVKKYSAENPLKIEGGDGNNYQVYYVAKSDSESSNALTTVKIPKGASYTVSGNNLPKGASYTVSGNNLDGFIITVNLGSSAN